MHDSVFDVSPLSVAVKLITGDDGPMLFVTISLGFEEALALKCGALFHDFIVTISSQSRRIRLIWILHEPLTSVDRREVFAIANSRSFLRVDRRKLPFNLFVFFLGIMIVKRNRLFALLLNLIHIMKS